MRVLLDSNVILDFILNRIEFFEEADEIFVRLQNMEFAAYVSAITPVNTFYTSRKELGKDAAFIAVQELLNLVEICQADKAVLQTAFLLGFSDYEDAVQCASAMAENLDGIVTRNSKDYKTSPISVYSPTEFLEILQAESAG